MKQLIQFLIKKREIKLTLKQVHLQKELNYNLQEYIKLQRELNLLQEQKELMKRHKEEERIEAIGRVPNFNK